MTTCVYVCRSSWNTHARTCTEQRARQRIDVVGTWNTPSGMAHPSSSIFSWYIKRKREKSHTHTLHKATTITALSVWCVCVCDVKEGGVKGVAMSTCALW